MVTPYSYSKLNQEAQEIRLLTLLPGEIDEPIRITISHEPFDLPVVRRHLKPVKNGECDNLPLGWQVLETLEGRTFYNYEDPVSYSEYSLWNHPDPKYHIKNCGNSLKNIAETGPRFEALSYVWGSAESPQTIYVVNEENVPMTLEVGQNLACALNHLRHYDISKTVWIDAICINQKDMSERERQVKRMANIYSSACRVIVWLGPELENTHLAMSTLDYLGRQVEVTSFDSWGPSPDCTEQFWYCPFTELPYDKSTWKAMCDMLKLPWFERLWVLQEIQLANPESVMMCGNQEILWRLFRRAIIAIANKTVGPSSCGGTRRIFDRVKKFCFDKRKQNISSLLEMSASSKCTEQVDKIYGILGLAPQKVASKTRPDYSLSTGQVYRNLFLDHVRLINRLELLGFCKLHTRLRNVPTWVPNCSITHSKSLSLISYASCMSSTEVQFQIPSILKAIGVRCARILTLGQGVITSNQELIRLAKSTGMQELYNEIYITGESLLEAYASTIFLAEFNRRLAIGNARRHIECVERSKKYILMSLECEKEFQDDFNRHSRWPLSKTLDFVVGCKFATTVEGHIGYVPSCTKPDDIVCILLGCAAPVVLRQTPKGDFEVVGECYFHGVMYGETLLGRLPHPWIVRNIHCAPGIRKPRFFNPNTEATAEEDPRLEPLPDEWERIEREQTSDDPILFSPHINKITKEEINFDPRFLPAALEARGVKLEEFRLV